MADPLPTLPIDVNARDTSLLSHLVALAHAAKHRDVAIINDTLEKITGVVDRLPCWYFDELAIRLIGAGEKLAELEGKQATLTMMTSTVTPHVEMADAIERRRASRNN